MAGAAAAAAGGATVLTSVALRRWSGGAGRCHAKREAGGESGHARALSGGVGVNAHKSGRERSRQHRLGWVPLLEIPQPAHISTSVRGHSAGFSSQIAGSQTPTHAGGSVPHW